MLVFHRERCRHWQVHSHPVFPLTSMRVRVRSQAQLACLSFTASVVAIGKGLELSVTEAEYAVVTTAMENSDRCEECRSVRATVACGLELSVTEAEYAMVTTTTLQNLTQVRLGKCYGENIHRTAAQKVETSCIKWMQWIIVAVFNLRVCI